MGLATRSRTRVVCALLALVVLAMLVDAATLWRAAQTNALIASGTPIPDAPGQPPEVRFAQAHAIAQAQAQTQAQPQPQPQPQEQPQVQVQGQPQTQTQPQPQTQTQPQPQPQPQTQVQTQAQPQPPGPAASGARDAALNRYRALQGDPRLGAAARYNSANLLMRQAIGVRASIQPGQAIALLELAKEYYRDVLRDDPTRWDARYNLERAQRLLPDPGEDEAGPVGEAENRERAATTMRGYSPGLP